MRFFPLVILLFAVTSYASGQLTSSDISSQGQEKVISASDQITDLKIFPVPVLNGHLTITSGKSFISVRITNIIGQEVIREKYNYPQKRAELTFSNTEKGIYLVTIEFEDKTKTVRKILIDSSM